jgi:hypothetical protein
MGVQLNSRFLDLMEVKDQREIGIAFLPKERLHRLKWYGKRGGDLNVHNTFTRILTLPIQSVTGQFTRLRPCFYLLGR